MNKPYRLNELAKKPVFILLFDGIGVALLCKFLDGIAWFFKLNISLEHRAIIVMLFILICLILYCYKLSDKMNKIYKNATNKCKVGIYTDFNIFETLYSAQHNIFIIGITNNGMVSPVERWAPILDNEKGIVLNIILEEDDNLLKLMCDFWYGYPISDETLEHNRIEVKNVLTAFSTLDNYMNYLKRGQIRIRKANTIITSSFVVVDITRNYTTVTKDGIIQATFYQYNTKTDKSPCVQFNYEEYGDMYMDLGKSILDLWDSATPIDLKAVSTSVGAVDN